MTPTTTVAARLAASGSENEESRCGKFVMERNMRRRKTRMLRTMNGGVATKRMTQATPELQQRRRYATDVSELGCGANNIFKNRVH